MTPGIGHNNGPSLDDGASWRRFAWARSREALLPTLPIEVVRLRVARAKALGLPYRTYAGIRATTGHDIVAFLFSTNALRLLRPTDHLPDDRLARLGSLPPCDRTALVHPPLHPRTVLTLAPLDAAHPAPAPASSWSATRDHLHAVLRDRGHPPDRVVLVGETDGERAWTEAGRLAGFLSGEAYFAPLR
ncbi:hypothetical protein FHG66_04595 [Rubellimicrobium rubrum]|uniref:Uncharacterized protein n=1 Tax=Rubellimicrobium rubrum TaxID=2585369 RepID=A0A5C4N635_9RHOB|nr:hypothetical protein FHG66_04595 [Rubellimicrobium rubrum]